MEISTGFAVAFGSSGKSSFWLVQLEKNTAATNVAAMPITIFCNELNRFS